MLKSLLEYLPAINKEGYIFIVIFALVSLILLSFSSIMGWIGIILTIWCVTFFRDPDRYVPLIDSVVVSPADGKVESIIQARPPQELQMGDDPLTRVSIFLSVFDVHVNRIPVDGTVKMLQYHPGKFLSATLDKSSELNERQSILIESASGQEVAVVQIAGLIARRIVCNLDENQSVKAGERFGIIRFGSRVDIYLPEGVVPKVAVGQYMLGGETVIATLKGPQKALEAELRK